MFYKISAMLLVAAVVSGLGIYAALPNDEPKQGCENRVSPVPVVEGCGCCKTGSGTTPTCGVGETSCTKTPDALGACVGGSFAVSAKPAFTCCDD